MHPFLKYSLLLFTISFLTMPSANAQEIKVIDHKGTISEIRNNNVHTSATDPIIASNTIVENDIWIDTSTAPSTTKIWNATQWIKIETGSPAYTGSFKIIAPGSSNAVSQNFNQVIADLPFLPTQITFVAYTNIEDFPTDDSNQEAPASNSIQNTAGNMNGFVRNNGTAGFLQNVIFIATHGNSMNNISRYSSSAHCLGLRYSNNNGENLGVINAELISFDTNASNFGFTLNVNYYRGTSDTFANSSPFINDIYEENLIVLFTAYK